MPLHRLGVLEGMQLGFTPAAWAKPVKDLVGPVLKQTLATATSQGLKTAVTDNEVLFGDWGPGVDGVSTVYVSSAGYRKTQQDLVAVGSGDLGRGIVNTEIVMAQWVKAGKLNREAQSAASAISAAKIWQDLVKQYGAVGVSEQELRMGKSGLPIAAIAAAVLAYLAFGG